MSENHTDLEFLVKKLKLWRELNQDDVDALISLPYRLQRVRSHQYLVREGDKPQHCCLLISGYAIRHKTAGNGGRQILSIHMPGDLVDLHNSLLRVADHTIEALGACEVANIPIAAIRDIAYARPALGQAIWYETLVDASIAREWMLNVGRRDALTRTAHLLCEFAVRMEAAGLGSKDEYNLPMTQEQIADSLGLTTIHVNRTIKALKDENLISYDRRAIRILDPERLALIGDFDPRYLHLHMHQHPHLQARAFAER